MKYLALLRDSFREALDSKVIYFTFGLSLVVILLLLTVRFQPVSVHNQLDYASGWLNWAARMEAASKGQQPIVCEVSQCDQTNEAAVPWEGDYRITITMKSSKPLAGSEETQAQERDLQAKYMVLLSEMGLKNPQVQSEVSLDGRAVEVHFTTQGTTIHDARHWVHEPGLFFGAAPLSLFRSSLTVLVYLVENYLLSNIGGWIIVLIGVVVTAFFVPNMLQKGSLDLLLVKPITRVELLLLKYLGGLTFVFINSALAIGGVWLVLGLNSGIWAYGFLINILLITFFFAILYAVSILFGVLTRSSVLCIFMTCLVWALLFALGLIHTELNRTTSAVPVSEVSPMAPGKTGTTADVEGNAAWRNVRTVVNAIYTVLPRTSDLGTLSAELNARDLLSDDERRVLRINSLDSFKWAESLGVSFAFIAVMLGLACWRFAVKDY